MKICFNFGTDVMALPGAVREHLTKASAEDLRVLLSIAADPDMTHKQRAKSLGMTEGEVSGAVSFWRGAGIISAVKAKTSVTSDDAEKAAVSDKPKKRPPRNENLPRYTTEELTASLGQDDRGKLIEYCQQSIGRVFNAAEAEIVMGLCDYLNVSTEYVALLCDSLVKEKKGRMSLHVLEKSAIELYDRGITTTDELIAHFELRKKALSLSGQIRTLFGLGARSLTPAEDRIIEKWAGAGFEDGMIEYAYELTVNATGEAPLKYTDAIIDKWIAEKITTVDAAKAHEEEFQKTKAPKPRRGAKAAEPTASSFSTDDFFEAALMRSYNTDTEDAK